MTVRFLSTELDYINNMISDSDGSAKGIPEHSWLAFAGPPGSGKTSLSLCLFNSLLALPDTVGLYLNKEMSTHNRQGLQEALKLRFVESKGQPLDYLDPAALSDILLREAQRAEEAHKTLIVLIDSLQSFYTTPSTSEAIRFANFLERFKQEHPVILLTVLHVTKGKTYAGPMKLQQACDVLIDMKKDSSNFFHMSTMVKNRYYVPGSPAVNKLERTVDGLVVSHEPDFISQNPIVAFFRQHWRKQ